MEWLNIINPLNHKYLAGQNLDSYRIHGIPALIASYFSKNENGTFQFLISSLSASSVRLMVLFSQLALILLSLFFLSTKPFRPFISSKSFALEVSYLLLITPLIFPQQNKWAFVYIIPALTVIFADLVRQDWRREKVQILLLAIMFALTTLTTDGIIGMRLSYYAECLKLVTIGTLLIVPLLCWAKANESHY